MTMRYGEVTIELTKSEDTVAMLPMPGRRHEALAALEASEDTSIQLDGFRLARISKNKAEMERALDMARPDPSVAVGTHVYYTSDDRVPFVPSGQLYLVFRDGANLEQCQDLITQQGLELLEARGEKSFIVRVTQRSVNPVKVAIELQKSPLVEVAEPDLLSPARLFQAPAVSDDRLADQWHLMNTGKHRGTSLGFKAGADARVVEAWERSSTLGSPNVIVAVIDDGFDLDHPDLSGPGKIVAPWDFQRQSNRPLPEVDLFDQARGDWHGTACAGVVLGAADGAGIVGVVPGCRLMPIRWGSSLADEQFEEWFRYALSQGAGVISCSWGAAARYYPLSTRKIDMLRHCAMHGRDGRGTIVCFAAGNENRDINDPGKGSVNGFATHPDVIAVAASTSMDEKSNYSNFGHEISLTAPSSGAGGWGISTSDVTGTYQDAFGRLQHRGYSPDAFTDRFGGTSSACPLVAGICALLLSISPDLRSYEVKNVLEQTARRIGDVDSYQQGHSIYHGYGCVNASAAVERLLDDLEPHGSRSR